MAGLPVVYVGDTRSGREPISDVFVLSSLPLPCTEKVGGGFWRVLGPNQFQAEDRVFPRGGESLVVLAGGTLLECSSGGSWAPVSYFLNVGVSAAFVLDGQFLAVLGNGSAAVVATSPAGPRFAVAELQGQVTTWDVFPQGTALESWLGLDAGLWAKRDFDFEVTELEVGRVVFDGARGAFSAVSANFATSGDFAQVVVAGGRIFGLKMLDDRGEVYLG